MSTPFDRILTSTPMGRTAAVVTSESRDNFVSRKKIVQRHSENPFKTRAPGIGEIGNPQFTDLTGREFGRFRVIGIWESQGVTKHQARPGNWVCRCVCGRFETRKSKAIRNPLNTSDRCGECRNLEYLRDTERKKALGKIKSVSVEEAVAKIKSGVASACEDTSAGGA